MDNAQKAIMIGVGLFITIIIISSVLLISNMGTNLITSAQSQLSGITKGLQNQIYYVQYILICVTCTHYIINQRRF